jgi:dTDP-4-dehydrorhamnose 3,5-epimerase
MNFTQTKLSGLWLIESPKAFDARGYFSRSYCRQEFAEHGIVVDFVQSNISYNAHKATLRGLHFQRSPHAEDKLVRCVQGSIFDVAVDLRENSATYRDWFGVELSGENGCALLVPKGFAHGFISLVDNSIIQYHVSELYAPEAEYGIRWDDPAIGIRWPINPTVISQRDREHPLL